MNRALLLVVLVAPAVAVAVAATRRGGLAHLSRLRLRGAAWVVAGAAAQAVRTADPAWAPHGAWVGVWLAVCLLGFAWANVRSAGRPARVAVGVLALGTLANVLATVVNGGMPFSVAAARTAGMSPAAIAAPTPGHVPLTGDTHLAALADVVPVPGLHIVFSVGDVLLWAGLAALLVVAAAATSRLPGRQPGALHHPVDVDPGARLQPQRTLP